MNDHHRRSGEPRADRRADYARQLAQAGDPAAAADLMRQALELAPAWPAGWVALGGYLESAGAPDAAVAAYASALALDAADGEGAGLKLAALGAAPTPDTAPPAFVRGLFDQYAERFETSLVGALDYRVPDALFAAIEAAAGPGMRLSETLDLGCGTGLMGERLRPVSMRLTGVDLSPGMLGKARRKAIYDRLVEADIAGFRDGAEGYDLVAAADVLIYVGDLAPVFATVASLLRPGGIFGFSLEAHEGEEAYEIQPSLRYAHSPASVARLAAAAGLTVLSQARVVLRQDRGGPVAGTIMVAERGSVAEPPDMSSSGT